MKKGDDLGRRMKDFYERIPKTRLIRRMPVIIRVDGKAFHTYTRGFRRPFDSIFIKTMQETTKYLCENIQGCVFGYCQSDEISLALVDYQKFESEAWFDYEVQKMCSIAASMAAMSFNRLLRETASGCESGDYPVYAARFDQAVFDARVFDIPKEEAANYFYWR